MAQEMPSQNRPTSPEEKEGDQRGAADANDRQRDGRITRIGGRRHDAARRAEGKHQEERGAQAERAHQDVQDAQHFHVCNHFVILAGPPSGCRSGSVSCAPDGQKPARPLSWSRASAILNS